MSKDKKERSWFGRHKILTVIGMLIVIVIIASVASGGSKSSTSSTAKSSGSTASSSSKKAATTAKIGQPADDGKFEFTVTSIKCGEPNVSDSTGYLTKTAQGQYCLLNLSVKNIGNEAQTLDSTSQYLYNASGQQYKSDSEATIDINPSNGTFLNSINPGNTVNGIVVFDIPKDQTPVIAELHDSAFSGGVKVNL
ncbi:MAG TPA: DUF4352 domain-containing protein, partial [Candidatus Saccharimonadales bacterium]|nr:DUF4352 domain-containing protein [Candidatus Saccharimonadales bacterium]